MRRITFSKNLVPCPHFCTAAWLLLALLTGPLVLTASGQGTTFTYQGRLTDGGGPASGNYDFRFRLAADPLGNNFVAGPVLTNAVAVSGGLFTVTLDFGSVFTGSNYWLQIDVRTNGAGSYSTLAPLQALTPAPYAIFAGGASNLLGAVPAAQLSGTIGSPQLAGTYSNPLNFSNAANQFSGTFNGNGGGLSNVNAAALGGLAVSNFWQLGGNNVGASQFLGSTNNQPLEIHVNGQRALRLEPNINGAPNLLGGSSLNFIAPGTSGGVIAGGGTMNYFGSVLTNSIASDYDFIGGGIGNGIGTNAAFSAIAAGYVNQIGPNSDRSFIGAGSFNQALASASTIGGGSGNQVGTNSSFSSVGGGVDNMISPNASESTIAGGGGNQIQSNSGASTIAGGFENQILTNTSFATIAGGLQNQIGPSVNGSFIGGGGSNLILTNSQYAVIAGGNANVIQSAASYSSIVGGNSNTNDGYIASIGGGEANVIQFAADHAVIAGGGNNTIVGSLTLPVFDTIGGGNWNTVQTNSIFSVIAGGQSNVITAGAAFSSISGGNGNIIFPGAPNATIAGGSNNVAGANGATVVGGLGNSALSPTSVAMGNSSTAHGFAAIAMGQNTVATGNNSLAAGVHAQATNQGAFVWSDQSFGGFSSTNDNSFNVRASGGMRFFTSGAGMSLDGPLGVTSGAISGNGGSLTNVNASTLAGLALSNFWKTGGNNGVTSNQFLGTVDASPVEFRVNSFRALRLEPNTNGAPNVIGGSAVNWVAPGVSGAVIGGGGATNYYAAASYRNFVGADFGVIAGGLQNIIDIGSPGEAASIGGGEFNYITNSPDSLIGNGWENFLQDSAQAVIGGGNGNVVLENTLAVVGGGYNNSIGRFVGPFGVPHPNTANTIGGGIENSIPGAIGAGTISGGFGNMIAGNGGMIPGGAYNIVQGDYSFAAGSNAVALNKGCFVWADAIGQPFTSGADNQFLIRATGGVGIGTTNPATALEVNGTVTANAFAGNGFQITGNSYINGGRLGVGLTAPEASLHVASGSAGIVTANANSIGVFERSTAGYVSVLTPAANEGGLLFGNPGNNTDGGIIFNNSLAPHGLQFRTGGNLNQMTIQSSGNVGIGTTSPSRTLHLVSSGDTELGIQSSDTNGHLWTLQSSAVNGSGRDASFQIIDRTVGLSRLLIASNGFVGIGITSPTNSLEVSGNISCSSNVFAHGVLLTSDRNAKENFATLNPENVLARLVSLPVTEWNYKGDDPQIKHVGPMAQDFRAAFGLNGNDDTHISAVDESGVALAAIQGLNQKLTEELQRRDAENVALKQRLERLEQLLAQQSHR